MIDFLTDTGNAVQHLFKPGKLIWLDIDEKECRRFIGQAFGDLSAEITLNQRDHNQHRQSKPKR